MARDGDVPDTLIVASEPLTYELDDWTLVPRNHMVVAHADPAAPHRVARVEMRPVHVTWTDFFGLTPSASPAASYRVHTGGEPVDAAAAALSAAQMGLASGARYLATYYYCDCCYCGWCCAGAIRLLLVSLSQVWRRRCPARRPCRRPVPFRACR
jgi:hypothetical protein